MTPRLNALPAHWAVENPATAITTPMMHSARPLRSFRFASLNTSCSSAIFADSDKSKPSSMIMSLEIICFAVEFDKCVLKVSSHYLGVLQTITLKSSGNRQSIKNMIG
jgi:hypothetical protein